MVLLRLHTHLQLLHDRLQAPSTPFSVAEPSAPGAVLDETALAAVTDLVVITNLLHTVAEPPSSEHTVIGLAVAVPAAKPSAVVVPEAPTVVVYRLWSKRLQAVAEACTDRRSIRCC